MNDLPLIRRRCRNGELYPLIAAAVANGARTKVTKSGVVLYGPKGSAHTHFSPHGAKRSVQNFRAGLRRAGLL